MQHKNRINVIAFAMSLVITVLSLYGLLALNTEDIKRQQQEFSVDFLSLIDQMSDETQLSLMYLNKIDESLNQSSGPVSETYFCSDEKLLEMRRTLFRAKHLKEIGFYYGDKLICDTSMGRLDEPFERTAPDLISARNHKVWINIDLPFTEEYYEVYLVKGGKYHAVLDPAEIFAYGVSGYRWEWVYKDDSQQRYLHGEKGLFNRVTNTESPVPFPIIASFKCSENSTYCVAVAENAFKMLSTLEVYVGITLLLLVTVLSFISSRQFTKYFYSQKRRVKRGFRNRSFYPAFQPIVDINSGEVIGCEVLARFEDTQGTMTPDVFIPLVVELGKTTELTRIMLKTAHKELLGMHQLTEGFKVSFNFFPTDLTVETYERIKNSRELFDSRFKLVFELTEDVPFRTRESLDVVQKLRELGIDIAIDDFGTGYANLKQIQQTNFDLLKIDRSFIKGLESRGLRGSFVTHIVDIANQLDIPVVAEGVETAQQLSAVRNLGIDYVQGYFFGRPMSALELNQLVGETNELSQTL